MATTKLDYVPADVQLSFMAGDDLVCRVNMGANITGRTYDAGITDSEGNEVTPISCTVIDAATGIIDLTLTDVQTEALQLMGKSAPCWSWWFSETISGITKTILAGKLNLRFR